MALIVKSALLNGSGIPHLHIHPYQPTHRTQLSAERKASQVYGKITRKKRHFETCQFIGFVIMFSLLVISLLRCHGLQWSHCWCFSQTLSELSIHTSIRWPACLLDVVHGSGMQKASTLRCFSSNCHARLSAMHVPRTDGTERLKPFSRQFFQWHYIDTYTLWTVEELFLRLFLYLLFGTTPWHVSLILILADSINEWVDGLNGGRDGISPVEREVHLWWRHSTCSAFSCGSNG